MAASMLGRAKMPRQKKAFGWLALGALALLTAGCTAEGPGPTASSQGFGPTVAFESVDGPPPQVFQRLVKVLETEGTTRHISVVSRDANPTYRVRSYYAAQVKRGTHNASIAWVWDVYAGDQSRAARLSGTEPAGTAGADAWDAASDQVLRRISQAGLSGLTNLVNGGAAPVQSAPPVPETAGPAVAGLPAAGTPETGAPAQALAFSGQ
ncbi:hypothetical protein [[Pseudomonas] carboxydohydrogena]